MSTRPLGRALLAALVLAALVLAAGCSLLRDDTEVRPVAVTEIERLEQSGRTVRFSVTGQWRNTCGEVSRIASRREGRTYAITLYGQQPKGAQCGDAITPITGEWSTTVPEAGTYTFAFEQGEKPPLDTTLVIERRREGADR